MEETAYERIMRVFKDVYPHLSLSEMSDIASKCSYDETKTLFSALVDLKNVIESLAK